MSHPGSRSSVPSSCRTPSSGPQTTPAPVPPGGPRPRGAELLLVSFPHLYIHCQGMMAPRPWLALCLDLHGCWNKSTQRSHPLASASFDHVSLGLGERRLSFKLTNLFPNSLWASAVPSPYPISLLILWGSLPYRKLSWFSQATLFPFMWAFWLLLHISQRRNFSLTGSPSPGSLRGWTGRSPGSSVLASSRIPSIWPAMGQSPGESGSCISDVIRLNVWCHFAPFIAN